MKSKILLFFSLLIICSQVVSGQTTYLFATAPALTSSPGFPSSWKNIATVTISGVQYRLTAGGNGTWTFLGTGGSGNSSCLQKDGSGGDQLTIERVDGQPFQFYGLWLKHNSMYYLPYYYPPYYTINYNLTTGSPETFVYNNSATSSTESYSKNLSVTSVSISFSSILTFNIDNLIVGPVASTPLSATSSGTSVSCNGGSNGTATVVAAGGTAPYTYSWSPSGGTSASASGLSVGSYTCTITDAASGSVTQTVAVTQPAALITAGSQTNIACYGGNSGSATVSASGGTSPYTYSWVPSGGSGATANNLSAGTYTCTVTDAKGCSTSRNFTLTQPSLLSVAPISQTNVACNSGTNGAAIIDVPTGGTGSYSINWTPGNPTGDGTRIVSGLSAGAWTATVTDANGCTVARLFNITQPAAYAVTSSQTNVGCNGGNDGSATVSVTGASAPYFYSWSPSGGTSATATGLSAGAYTCTITDVNGCSTTKTVTITQPVSITVSAAGSTAICSGSSTNFSLNSTTSGALFNWTAVTTSGTVSGAAAGAGSSVSQTLSGSGTVRYSITPSLGVCLGVATTVDVTVLPLTTVTSQPQNKSTSVGGNTTFSITASNATGYQWQVNSGSGFTSVSNTGVYSGATTATLAITSATSALNGYQYRCVATGSCSPATSAAATLTTQSNNASLSGIAINQGTLTPSFSSGTRSYSVSVDPNTASVQVTPTTSHANAAVTVNGQTVSSGSPATVALQGGSNTITIVVTAEDGVTQIQYTIVVFRASVSVTSLQRASAAYTNAQTVTFSLQFSGTATGLGAQHLSLSATGTLSGYAIQSVTPTGSGTYTVSANTGSGNGTLNLNLLNSTNLSAPVSGLPYSGTDGYIIDRTAPEAKGKSVSATLGANGTVTITPSSVNNGSTDNSSASGSLTYTLSKSTFASSDLGNNQVVFTVTDQAGNSSDTTLVITIQKNITTVASVPAVHVIYGEQPVLPQQVAVTYSDLSQQNVAVNWDLSAYTGKAGSFQLTGTLANGAFITNSATVAAGMELIVDKRPLTVSLTGDVGKVYDRSVAAYVDEYNYESDKLPNDEVNILGVASYDNKNAGPGKTITVRQLQISGADADNYSLTTDTAFAAIGNIMPRALHITLIGSVEKTYDANTSIVLSNTNYSGNVLQGDQISFSSTATFDNKNAGQGKAVTAVLFQMSGVDAPNYILRTDTAVMTGTILKKDITATASATPVITKVYDGSVNASPAQLNFSLQHTESGDQVSVTGTASYDNKRVGTGKTVTINQLVLQGSDKNNYHLTTPAVGTTGNITGKTLTVSFSQQAAISKIYDGNTDAQISAGAYAVDGIVGSDNVIVNKPSQGSYDNRHAGNQKNVTVSALAISGSDAGNYILSSSVMIGTVGVIVPKEVSVTADSVVKVYGSNDPQLTYHATGLIGDEKLGGALSRATGKNVGIYPILEGSLTGGTDYTIASFTGAGLKITPAELVITADNKQKSQGTENPVFTITYAGFASGDGPSSLSKLPLVSTDATKVSPLGYYDISVAGATAVNYHISYVHGKMAILPAQANAEGSLKAWSSAPGSIEVRIYAKTEQDAAITLYTEIGQPLTAHQRHLNAGINTFTLPVPMLSSSTYVLSVWAKKFRLGQRVPVH